MTTVLESLNSGLRRALTEEASVYLLGEDILDPYGGAFKVTRGLSTDFPGRILTTPISEAGLTGLATGMALRGLRPVVELMFGDFLTLAADQLINHAAKFRWMYNDQVQAPLVVRTPMGGRRGYGPTHSQTLEKHFLGVPGLRVLAVSALGDPGSLLAETILTTDGPVLFIENKLLYPLHLNQGWEEFEVRPNPDLSSEGNLNEKLLQIRAAPVAVLTLAGYGYAVELARQAALELAYQYEILVELVVFEQLAPFHLEVLLESLTRTRRLLTIEEGGLTLGWGAEVIARAAETLGPRLAAVQRLAATDTPIPASPSLEAVVFPTVEGIIQTARRMVQSRET